MRVIKFRAWHKNNKSMIMSVTTNLLDRVYLIFMQYTGLNDVDGVEIYEGDIVEYSDFRQGGYPAGQQPKTRQVVEFNTYYGGYHFNGVGYLLPKDMKVIGNIYENPELVK